MTTTANKIAFFRKKKGLTQHDLRNEVYKRIGKKFRQGTISSWENGKTAPDMDVLNVLANILDVSVNELYEKTNNQEPTSTASLKDISLYLQALGNIQRDFNKGEKESAYNDLKELTQEIISELSEVLNQHEKVVTQLKAVKEIMRL
ncbi:helix-turn-helix domain-containing protein [Fulvivirga sediminis]|uniref:Helix-turn-helix domain-containing protein n=1 Tax=Fulvivirga sediminis TaxID=2803949 RepID=A0A937K0E3_9BACT|nr:helix-turn-helix domain-containing protein [Fulvivirga sediminis]MBL3656231.1 helix-turn-helix domain-containing protein [Fulvivirga sediminis]